MEYKSYADKLHIFMFSFNNNNVQDKRKGSLKFQWYKWHSLYQQQWKNKSKAFQLRTVIVCGGRSRTNKYRKRERPTPSSPWDDKIVTHLCASHVIGIVNRNESIERTHTKSVFDESVRKYSKQNSVCAAIDGYIFAFHWRRKMHKLKLLVFRAHESKTKLNGVLRKKYVNA